MYTALTSVLVQRETPCAENDQSDRKDHTLLCDPCDPIGHFRHTGFFVIQGQSLLADSYRWILDNTTFRQWHKDQQSRLLWVKGDPGKGKTMLLMSLPECWDTRRAGTNEGYFDFQQIAFYAHVDSCQI
ncbi:conserved hypothetical protein [Pyrenophora tritici-repentis Pt-1C-BFP]|uniref:Nephrocystin 3-like N-terminal domain-containing protein n=1 Tax=Pyrenophora tritici-repentis (strain Pt-1C-BFP) TaxID=426418 RepID=B2VXX4_PYRTR|nr:uncharacterized protein PTRG_02302 [Pyrenophora tritici-repentis Pt-1C-BFP]EDU44825.1 conserved hypothetical protein [Pyrenophora tritici-repentis Pt-1C-BFP]